MIYVHKVYSLLLKLEKKQNIANILIFTLPCCLPSNAGLASDLCSIHISMRGYTNMMAVT